jgi:hypothetical protein
MGAMPGSASQRNGERQGFRIAYHADQMAVGVALDGELKRRRSAVGREAAVGSHSHQVAVHR